MLGEPLTYVNKKILTNATREAGGDQMILAQTKTFAAFISDSKTCIIRADIWYLLSVFRPGNLKDWESYHIMS